MTLQQKAVPKIKTFANWNFARVRYNFRGLKWAVYYKHKSLRLMFSSNGVMSGHLKWFNKQRFNFQSRFLAWSAHSLLSKYGSGVGVNMFLPSTFLMSIITDIELNSFKNALSDKSSWWPNSWFWQFLYVNMQTGA